MPSWGEKQREMIEVQSKNEALLNQALNEFFWTQGRYPTRLSDLVEREHPWFDELPLDPFTEKADWLVLHKEGKMKGHTWMNQDDFPLAGIPVAGTGGTEGIYIVKHR